MASGMVVRMLEVPGESSLVVEAAALPDLPTVD